MAFKNIVVRPPENIYDDTYQEIGGLLDSSQRTASYTASANAEKIQEALDQKGKWKITLAGNYFYPGLPGLVTSPPAEPGIMSIGGDTSLYIASGVNFSIATNAFYGSFLYNKAMMGNKSIVSSWSVGADFGLNQMNAVTLNVSPAMDIEVGDSILIGGDWNSGANLEDCYEVMAVNTPGAATQVTFWMWRNEMDGLTKSVLDTVYVYKADSNIDVNIQGMITSFGTVGTGGFPAQNDAALFMFNKTKDLKFSCRVKNVESAKTVILQHSYTPKIGTLEIYNAGAGLTVFGPSKGVVCDTITKYGGEDALLVQNVPFQNTLRDADGTQISGDVNGVVVNNMVIKNPSGSGFTIMPSNDVNDLKKPLKISGVVINNLRYSTGSTNTSIGILKNRATNTGGVGGNMDIIKINNLEYEDRNPVGAPAVALFIVNGENSPAGFPCFWGGLEIDSFNVDQDTNNPVSGIRSRLFSVGTGLPTGMVFDKFAIHGGNLWFDQQNVSGTNVLVFGSPNFTINDVILSGKYQTALQMQALAISAGGTGYTAGDILYCNTGTPIVPAKIRVDTVSAGVITAITVLHKGRYLVLPSSPATFTGGTGTSATFSYTNTIFSVVFQGGSAGSIVSNVRLDEKTTIRLSGTGSVISAGNSGTTTNIVLDSPNIILLNSLAGAMNSGSFRLTANNIDFAGITNNIGFVNASITPAQTYELMFTGCKFNPVSPAVTIGSALTFTGGLTFNWRSGGGNTGLTNGANSMIWRFYASINCNFIGNCQDYRQNLDSATVLMTIGRIDGASLWEIGGTVGAPGAIGVGLVDCYGTAAGSWKPRNPTKVANSY